jgi:hypothetical protein
MLCRRHTGSVYSVLLYLSERSLLFIQEPDSYVKREIAQEIWFNIQWRVRLRLPLSVKHGRPSYGKQFATVRENQPSI